MPLHDRVASYVNGWRFLFTVVSSISFVILLLQGEFFQLAIAIPLAFMIYHLGFFAMLHWLLYSTPPEVIIEEIKNQKIININERLSSGTLEPGEELDDLLKDAGLRALTQVCTFGPVIGKYNDLEFFEWIGAKEGYDGEIKKYNYIGKCETDSAGNLKTPSAENFYILYDDILYEHIPQN